MDRDNVFRNPIYSGHRVNAQIAAVATNPPPHSTPQSHIMFRFSYRATFHNSILNQDLTETVLSVNEGPLLQTFVPIKLHRFLRYKKAHDMIGAQLENFPIPDQALEHLIGFTWRKAWTAVKSMPARHNHMYLHIHVAHDQYFRQIRGWVDQVVQHSMDVDQVRMIPSDDSSIEALGSKKILSLTEYGTCSICLEEFSVGCEAACMPCEHAFHEDCIRKWLRTSHYCPLCRFEMPTR